MLEARARDPDDLFAGELHHRGEHSVELQAVWLRRVYGAGAPPILPVLCGSLPRAVVTMVDEATFKRETDQIVGRFRKAMAKK